MRDVYKILEVIFKFCILYMYVFYYLLFYFVWMNGLILSVVYMFFLVIILMNFIKL